MHQLPIPGEGFHHAVNRKPSRENMGSLKRLHDTANPHLDELDWLYGQKGKGVNKLQNFLSKLPHPVRWTLVLILGTVFLLMGLVMMVTPGPGLLFIFFGLTILAIEIEWARELNKQGLQGLEKIVAKLKSVFRKKPKS